MPYIFIEHALGRLLIKGSFACLIFAFFQTSKLGNRQPVRRALSKNDQLSSVSQEWLQDPAGLRGKAASQDSKPGSVLQGARPPSSRNASISLAHQQ